MQKAVVLDLKNLKEALKTLKFSLEIFKSGNVDENILNMYADSCIQRFEYTFETVWKIMKKYFKIQYAKTDEELTMNNIFRYMESYRFIKDWQKWKFFYEQRNNTAHEYNFLKSRELVKIIPDFIEEVDFILQKFENIQI